MSSSVAASLIVAIVIIMSDSWVYLDAKAHADQGAAVVFKAGSFVVDTPIAWFLACLLLWVIFFPLYLTNRS